MAAAAFLAHCTRKVTASTVSTTLIKRLRRVALRKPGYGRCRRSTRRVYGGHSRRVLAPGRSRFTWRRSGRWRSEKTRSHRHSIDLHAKSRGGRQRALPVDAKLALPQQRQRRTVLRAVAVAPDQQVTDLVNQRRAIEAFCATVNRVALRYRVCHMDGAAPAASSERCCESHPQIRHARIVRPEIPGMGSPEVGQITERRGAGIGLGEPAVRALPQQWLRLQMPQYILLPQVHTASLWIARGPPGFENSPEIEVNRSAWWARDAAGVLTRANRWRSPHWLPAQTGSSAPLSGCFKIKLQLAFDELANLRKETRLAHHYPDESSMGPRTWSIARAPHQPPSPAPWSRIRSADWERRATERLQNEAIVGTDLLAGRLQVGRGSAPNAWM